MIPLLSGDCEGSDPIGHIEFAHEIKWTWTDWFRVARELSAERSHEVVGAISPKRELPFGLNPKVLLPSLGWRS